MKMDFGEFLRRVETILNVSSFADLTHKVVLEHVMEYGFEEHPDDMFNILSSMKTAHAIKTRIDCGNLKLTKEARLYFDDGEITEETLVNLVRTVTGDETGSVEHYGCYRFMYLGWDFVRISHIGVSNKGFYINIYRPSRKCTHTLHIKDLEKEDKYGEIMMYCLEYLTFYRHASVYCRENQYNQ